MADREDNPATSCAYVTLQQVEHALLGNLLGVVELLQRLLELVLRHLPLTLLLVIKVQTATLQLLQVMLQRETKANEERILPKAAISLLPESLSGPFHGGSAADR